jgi:hypothetical protein
MQPGSDEILSAAMKLPEDERLTLAARILETVPEQPGGLSLDDPELVEELRRRSADRAASVSWSTLRDEL